MTARRHIIDLNILSESTLRILQANFRAYIADAEEDANVTDAKISLAGVEDALRMQGAKP